VIIQVQSIRHVIGLVESGSMKLTDINEWVCGKCNCEPCRCDSVVEKWSSKYKKSIDCSNPKGFSQKAHCAGRKKKKSESVEEQIGTGRRLTVQPHMTGLENPYQKQNKRELKVFTQAYKDTYDQARAAQNKADATGGPGASYQTALMKPKFSPQVVPPRTKPKKPRPTLNPPLNNSIQELKIVKPDSVDTKGLKRSQMPQIHKDDYNEFIDYLKDNGAEFTKQTMPAKQLKATQGEFSDKGVMKQIGKQMAGEPRKPVIASQDNFIIDGHHRWLVAWNIGDTVDVFKVNIDADKLLELVKKFPKTTYKDIYTEELYDFDKDEPMKSTVAVPGYGTMSIDGLMKNLVQSVTELLAKMKQGTDGMRFADYELNKNGVVTAKLSALIKALDDLQAIRKQGGARSRNIQKEQDAEQEQQELPINTDAIMGRIQEFESKQFVTPQDADLMRRGVQSLESARQTLNPKAILQLLTMVTS